MTGLDDDHLKIKRNRHVCFTSAHVETDGRGAITYRPLVRNPTLPCFGLPHRYWRGEFDQQSSYWKNGEELFTAQGCAGCKVRPACGQVAVERLGASPELTRLHDRFEAETRHIAVRYERYKHPAWLAFDCASRAQDWFDYHDGALEADKAMRALRERKRRSEARRPANKLYPIAQDVQDAIEVERLRRAAILLSLRKVRGTPRFITSLPPESRQRTADIWAARELLRRRLRRRVTAKAIAELLTAQGRAGNASVGSLTSRVIEAYDRIDRLESEDVWKPFTALPRSNVKRSTGVGMVDLILEDDLPDPTANPVKGTVFLTG